MIHSQAYLNLVLEDPSNHETDGKGNVVWSNIYYPEDITEFVILTRTGTCTKNSFGGELVKQFDSVLSEH